MNNVTHILNGEPDPFFFTWIARWRERRARECVEDPGGGSSIVFMQEVIQANYYWALSVAVLLRWAKIED